ncbi:MAG TPA: ribonuclease Z [Virgibacillus sp.]|nr:ribonuclease Z [Virgibacillus sp.]
MELTFLGTGAGIPSKERNVSAIALTLLQDLNRVWLFDCGESTQHQILNTSIKPRKINKIFITHLHGDHIFGLPGLLSSRSFQSGDEDLTVYGPKGIKRYIETSLEVSQTRLTYNLNLIEFTEGIIIDNELVTVTCKQLDHRIPSYGFRIVEKDKPGELLVDKLKKRGIQPGPIYQKIKDNETTHLDDGTILNRDEFVGPKKPGRIICILGDTRHTEQNEKFVEHADLLVHEATFSHDRQSLARKYYHSTTVEAALLAKNSQVKKLILTHISSRYQGEDDRELRNEAIAIFPETILAKDFYQFEVN